jgi:hypothetical protein
MRDEHNESEGNQMIEMERRRGRRERVVRD